MSDGKVRIEIEGDDKGFRTKVRDLPKAAEEALGRASGKEAGAKAGREFAESAKSSVQAGAVAIGTVLAGAITSAVGSVGDLISEGIASSDAMSKFRQTMEFALIDPETIDASLSRLKEYADQTVYEMDTVLNMASQLAANGVEDFVGLTEAAGNLNAVAGGSAETMKSVALVMTQTAGDGRLLTENWNQLAEAIPGASGRLQRAMLDAGAYTGNFREAMEAGEITAQEFNAAIMELGSEPIAQEAATSVETFEGAVGNAKASVVDGFREMYDAANEDGRVTRSINRIGDALGDLLRDAAPVFGDLVEGAADLVEAIGDIPEPVKRAAAGMASVAVAAKGFTAVKTAATGVTSAVKGVSAAVGGLSGGLAGLGLTALVAVIGGVVQGMAETEQAMEEAAQRADDLEVAAGGVAEAISRVDPSAFDGVSSAAGAASSSVSAASESAAEFRDRMVASMQESRESVASAADGFREMADSVAEAAASASTVESYARTMDGLRDTEGLTASQQNRLRDAVEAFNEATGSSIEIVDEQNGVLDTSRERIEAITRAYSDQARVQGYTDTLSQLYSDQAAQMQEVERAVGDLGDAYLRMWDEAYGSDAVDEFARGMMMTRDELAQTAAESDEMFARITEAMAQASGQGVVYAQSVEGAGSATSASAEAVAAAREQYDNYRSALDGTNSSIELYEGALDDAAASAEESGAALEGLGGKVEEAGEAADGAARSLGEMNDALEPALKGMRGSAEGVEDLGAALDGIAASADPVAGALDDAERALDDFDRTGGDISDLARDLNAALRETGDVTVDLTDAQVLYAYQTGMTVDQLHSYAAAQSEAAQAAEEAAEAQEKAAEEERERVDGLLESYAGFAGAHAGFSEALAASGTDLESFALGLDAVGVSFEDFESSFESLSSAVNPLEKLSGETEMYTWKMRDNLVANTEAVRNYSSNVSEMYSRVTNEQEMAFADYVAGLGIEQADFLNYLMWDADVSFQELAQLYYEGVSAASEGAIETVNARAQAMAEVTGRSFEECKAVIEAGASEATSGVGDAMAEGADGSGAADKASGEFAEGLLDGRGEATTSADLLGEGAMDALMGLPEEMRARGEAAGGMLAVGLAQGTSTIPAGVASVSSSIGSALAPLAGQMGAAASAAGEAFSAGLSGTQGGASAAGSALSSAVGSSLSGFPAAMSAQGASGGTSFASGVSGAQGDASASGTALSASVGSALSSFPAAMQAQGVSGGSSFAGGVGGRAGDAGSAGASLGSSALSALGSFAADAYWSGHEMGSNYAAGIRAATPLAVDAAAGAAAEIAAYLHFSEPEKGALRGINASGGEMVRNYARSMLSEVPELESASGRAAEAADFAGLVAALSEGPWAAADRSLVEAALSAPASSRAQGAQTRVTYSIGKVELRAADVAEAQTVEDFFADVLRKVPAYG